MNDYFLSLIRTWVPIAVAWVLTYFAMKWGVVLDDDISAQLATGATALVAAIYYALVRALEKQWPWAGKLLGSSKKPAYVEPRR